jgi:hypothetical protein
MTYMDANGIYSTLSLKWSVNDFPNYMIHTHTTCMSYKRYTL